ncbi:D-xylose transport system substrate-binding protein [Mobilisporobacter senegalensis]|uniref:D-xylose transport system substrate-binding protein n=1 Tax=Mobilisporobacter senegalensis TaxID=1329262 RepID=A0A3N1XYQ5_9FIRM|nr:substrate-binding domain-containing protein [Mobilisporobacter senegalensis]ROR30372.1 D-xylose transport system substrate-binding protein [Mobilisporobacter senegalensis]
MRKKVFQCIALIILTAIMSGGCTKQNQAPVLEEKEKSDSIKIGMTFDSFILERWQRDRDIFVSKAKELGAEVNVQNANGDLKEQISQIEYFIGKKMDVIVIIAIDSKGITDVVNKAKKEGIKVIAYDRLIQNAGVDLYISFDNEKVGTLMARHMREHLGDKGKILMINGPLADNNVPLVMAGFQSEIEKTDINIIGIEHASGWHAETAFSVTNEYLMINDIDGIMCGNDNLAGQAIKALAERRLAGKICVVGQDADLDACQRIVEGTQDMTVYKPVERLASLAAEFAVNMAKGEEVKTAETFFDGINNVPYEKLEPISVTKENIDEVIVGEYHLEEDVYLNIPKGE